MTAADRFAELVAHFAGRPGVSGPAIEPAGVQGAGPAPDSGVGVPVTRGEATIGRAGRRRGFGSDALTVDGSIFAMPRADRLVVKLPADRVQALITDGDGEAFLAGNGRPMREWVTLAAAPDDEVTSATWRALAEEALRFVAG